MNFLRSPRKAKRWRRKVDVSLWSSRPPFRLIPGAACSQEISALDLLPWFAPKWQINGMLHSVKAPDRWSLQHNQDQPCVDAQDHSNTIHRTPGPSSTTPTTKAWGSRPSIAEPFGSTWKSSQSKTSWKSMSLLQKPPLDIKTSNPYGSRTWSCNTRWLTDSLNLTRDVPPSNFILCNTFLNKSIILFS